MDVQCVFGGVFDHVKNVLELHVPTRKISFLRSGRPGAIIDTLV